MKFLEKIRDSIDNVLFARRMPIPKPLDLTILLKDDEELCWAAHSEACEALKQARGSYSSKVRYLSEPWRMIYSLVALDCDVINGGFHQFFTNAGGIYDDHLINDVERFGQDQLTEIVRRAWAEYTGHDYTDQWANRGRSWERFAQPYNEGRFQQADRAYYEFVDEDSLAPYIGGYVREHFGCFSNEHPT